jgi:hypothetical protein
MQSWLTHHVPVLATTAASAAAIGGVVLWWVLTHRISAEERERERRQHLVLHGRIIDGSVLDWSEQPDSSELGTLHYRYLIAGVSYESAQDVTFLKDSVPVSASCLGTLASVRYDPKNPANSIIVAESWSGLRSPNIAETLSPPVHPVN